MTDGGRTHGIHRLLTLACVLCLGGAFASGCQGPTRLYVGPEKSFEEVSVVRWSGDLQLKAIGGNSDSGQGVMKGGAVSSPNHLLPGRYTYTFWCDTERVFGREVQYAGRAQSVTFRTEAGRAYDVVAEVHDDKWRLAAVEAGSRRVVARSW